MFSNLLVFFFFLQLFLNFHDCFSFISLRSFFLRYPFFLLPSDSSFLSLFFCSQFLRMNIPNNFSMLIINISITNTSSAPSESSARFLFHLRGPVFSRQKMFGSGERSKYREGEIEKKINLKTIKSDTNSKLVYLSCEYALYDKGFHFAVSVADIHIFRGRQKVYGFFLIWTLNRKKKKK